jgi:hypothetical protein
LLKGIVPQDEGYFWRPKIKSAIFAYAFIILKNVGAALFFLQKLEQSICHMVTTKKLEYLHLLHFISNLVRGHNAEFFKQEKTTVSNIWPRKIPRESCKWRTGENPIWMSGSDLCIPRNETPRPRYFHNRIVIFRLPISTLMYLWAIYIFVYCPQLGGSFKDWYKLRVFKEKKSPTQLPPPPTPAPPPFFNPARCR